MVANPQWDRWRLYGSAAVRSFAYGLTSVILGLYLKALGFDALHIGILLTAALAGGALLTLVVTLWSDRLGRRRTLVLLALMAAAGGLVFAFVPRFAPLFLFSFLGGINPTGKDRGSFAALEQSVMPQLGAPEERTWFFARYNLIGTAAAAAGSLAAGFPSLLRRFGGLGELSSYQAVFLVYAALAVVLVAIYATLSQKTEPDERSRRQRLLPQARSRGIIGGLSLLFGLDAFAGGFVVQSFLALWFHTKFGVSESLLGVIFFTSGLLSSLSFLAAARIAKRIGLLRTMVFTHLPSNGLLLLVPFMPVLWAALAVFLAREALSQMDVPTRQSYTVAVVEPADRTAASGITTLSRNAAQSAGPSLGGLLAQATGLATPIIAAALLKGIYDLALYGIFRHTRPPDEMDRADAATSHAHKA